MRRIAVVGHLSRDVVDGGEPRIGGAPWYAARALRVLGRRASVLAKCGEPDRRDFALRLAATGVPTSVVAGGETTAFSFRYDAGRRTMRVDAVGEPWRPEELDALRDADWIHVAPLLRSDFDATALAAICRGRRILLDAQGLVRSPQTGLLEPDAGFDRELLRSVSILKLAEDEAEVLGPLERLDVPEIVVTLGSRGSLVFVEGREQRIAARPVDGATDPTGAGDAFAAVYLAGRADGHAPASAARRATALVGGLLSGAAR